MNVHIKTQQDVEVPSEAKEFIYDKLNNLTAINKQLLSSRVTIKEIKNIIECQIKIVPASSRTIIVKSKGLSIRTAFLDAYHKIESLMVKTKQKNIDKRQKTNLGEII